MIQLPDGSYDSIKRMLEASKELHAALVKSPLWELVKNEPVIRQWMGSLQQVESIIIPKEDDKQLYGGPQKT